MGSNEDAHVRAAALCDELVTERRMVDVLRGVADTPAPSGASSLTRGEVVHDWFLEELLGHGVTLSRDHRRSGCDVLRLGNGGLRMLAHLDEVSYLVDGTRSGPGLWRVAPYCYHLAEDAAPARVVRFSPEGSWTVTGHGRVISKDASLHFEAADDMDLQPGDRVCLTSALNHDSSTGLVTGSLDNAAGASAALLAAAVLARLQIPFELVLTDEEEGPSGASSQTISRGAMRYFAEAEDAPLNVAIDIHGVPLSDLDEVRGHQVPWGASLAEFSSHGRGSVAPPHLYAAALRLLRQSPAARSVRQNIGGYVPRSDDVVAMTRSNRVLVLGYPGLNRHFDRGLPTANVHDLIELTRALVALGVGVAQGEIAGPR